MANKFTQKIRDDELVQYSTNISTQNLKLSLKDVKEECSRELTLIKNLDSKFNMLLVFISAVLSAIVTVINIFNTGKYSSSGFTITLVLVYFITISIYIFVGIVPSKLHKLEENKICEFVQKSHNEMLIDYINTYIKMLNSAKTAYRRKMFTFVTCIAVMCIMLIMVSTLFIVLR